MKATTIKIENPLLSDLRGILPPQKSVSAFVREILEKVIRKQRMTEAAQKYRNFMENNVEEKKWLEEWESSDLAAPPLPSSKGMSKK